MNIFVGNLSFDSTEADVRKIFKGFGSVDSVAIVMDKNGRKSRGFAFVQMPDEEAQAAITALEGKEFMGRPLNVAQARSKQGPREVSRKNSGYKQGRRSRSFMKRRGQLPASDAKRKPSRDSA